MGKTNNYTIINETIKIYIIENSSGIINNELINCISDFRYIITAFKQKLPYMVVILEFILLNHHLKNAFSSALELL